MAWLIWPECRQWWSLSSADTFQRCFKQIISVNSPFIWWILDEKRHTHDPAAQPPNNFKKAEQGDLAKAHQVSCHGAWFASCMKQPICSTMTVFSIFRTWLLRCGTASRRPGAPARPRRSPRGCLWPLSRVRATLYNDWQTRDHSHIDNIHAFQSQKKFDSTKSAVPH